MFTTKKNVDLITLLCSYPISISSLRFGSSLFLPLSKVERWCGVITMITTYFIFICVHVIVISMEYYYVLHTYTLLQKDTTFSPRKKSTSAERIFPINIEEERLWSFALLPFLLYGTVFEIGLSFRPSSSPFLLLFILPMSSSKSLSFSQVQSTFFTLIFCPILVLLAF